jgi:hypothetical protein
LRINEIRKCDLKLKYSKKMNKGKKMSKSVKAKKKTQIETLAQ